MIDHVVVVVAAAAPPAKIVAADVDSQYLVLLDAIGIRCIGGLIEIHQRLWQATRVTHKTAMKSDQKDKEAEGTEQQHHLEQAARFIQRTIRASSTSWRWFIMNQALYTSFINAEHCSLELHFVRFLTAAIFRRSSSTLQMFTTKDIPSGLTPRSQLPLALFVSMNLPSLEKLCFGPESHPNRPEYR